MTPEGYLLIDAENLAHKAAHAYTTVTSDGRPTAVLFGFLDQFLSVRGTFPRLVPVVVWDGGAKHRDQLAVEGIAKGVIPDGYKANRKRDPTDPFRVALDEQVPALRKLLSCTDVPQVLKEGYEADDVVASYANMLAPESETIVCFTSDHDYYQLVNDKVFVVSRNQGQQTIVGVDSFRATYGIEPRQWIDVGALAGDGGDNIHGVPGCGEMTALELVKKHGSWKDVISNCCSIFGPLRLTHPDLQDPAAVVKLSSLGNKNRNPYAGCYAGMPYTGVALALEEKKIKKCRRMELLLAMYQERIALAYKLKSMVTDLQLPKPVYFSRFDMVAFSAACDRYELNTVKSAAWAFKNGGTPFDSPL